MRYRYLLLTLVLACAVPCFGDTFYSVNISATYAGNNACGPSGTAVCVESFTASFIISFGIQSSGGFEFIDSAIYSPTIASIGPLGPLTCCLDEEGDQDYIAVFASGNTEFDFSLPGWPSAISTGTYTGPFGDLYRCIAQPCVTDFSATGMPCFEDGCGPGGEAIVPVFQTFTISEIGEPPTIALLVIGVVMAATSAGVGRSGIRKSLNRRQADLLA